MSSAIDSSNDGESGRTRLNRTIFTIRVFLLGIAIAALLLFGFVEVGMSFPVAWWLYLSVAATFALALIEPVPVRHQRSRVVVLAVILGIIAALYFVDWTTRKPFLRDLDRVRVGMTEPEVRRIMGRYMEGTGWPSIPGTGPTNAPGTLNIIGSGSQYSTETTSSNEMAIHDSLVFRHSNKPEFNSDWGIVSFSNGRVVHVEFSPD